LTPAIGVCACGGEGARDSAQASTLVVSAASSLKVPLELSWGATATRLHAH